MNSLSLHAVNASSSYEVSAVNDGCYQFFTDYGEIYSRECTFIKIKLYLCINL